MQKTGVWYTFLELANPSKEMVLGLQIRPTICKEISKGCVCANIDTKFLSCTTLEFRCSGGDKYAEFQNAPLKEFHTD